MKKTKQKQTSRIVGDEAERVLFIPDVHVPFHDEKAIEVVRRFALDFKPHRLIFLGDCIDCNGVSKFTGTDINEGFVSVLEEVRMFKEDVLDPLVKACGNPIVEMCLGNHEQRLEDAYAKLEEKGEKKLADYWRKEINLKRLYDIKKVYKYNEVVQVGKSELYATHGEYCNDAHAKKHVMTYGCNLVYGHLHSCQQYYFAGKAHGKPRKACCIGTLSRLDLDYMKRRASAWIHAFGVAYITGKQFRLYVPEIIDYKTIFNNKIYEA